MNEYKGKSVTINEITYMLDDEIDQGGNSSVYKARIPRDPRVFAIKILQTTRSKEKKERFLKEISFCKSVTHPNIVPIYGHGEIEKHLCYVMPLYPKTLRHLINTEHDYAALFDIILQLCHAIKYVHSQSIIHRDIKPENIFIAEDGTVVVDEIIQRLNCHTLLIELIAKQTRAGMHTPQSSSHQVLRGKCPDYMNLKEAFRYQNRIEWLMSEAKDILGRERNVTKVENTALRHKVNPEAEDETTMELPDTEYAEQITDIAVFLMFLLSERELLSQAIRVAKQGMDIDFDGEVSLNGKRQEMANIFRRMAEIRCSEKLFSGAGVGYKFNAEGNQVSYRCDPKKVTTINFDRNKVRSYATGLSKKADHMSAEIDKRMVNTDVAYEAPFDVNDTFAEVLQWHIDNNS